ncbi:MAG: PTS system mannose-specific IIA component [Planctomycetota bacterium]
MTVGLLLVTHNGIGDELKRSAEAIMKQDLEQLAVVSIPAELQPVELGKFADRVKQNLIAQDTGGGVLVLTDLYGATPNNLARHFSNDVSAIVLSGVNLPMLLRVLNYSQQLLQPLSETALSGGKNGILQGQL